MRASTVELRSWGVRWHASRRSSGDPRTRDRPGVSPGSPWKTPRNTREEEDMSFVSRGFRGRRRDSDVDAGRVPPGEYVTGDCRRAARSGDSRRERRIRGCAGHATGGGAGHSPRGGHTVPHVRIDYRETPPMTTATNLRHTSITAGQNGDPRRGGTRTNVGTGVARELTRNPLGSLAEIAAAAGDVGLAFALASLRREDDPHSGDGRKGTGMRPRCRQLARAWRNTTAGTRLFNHASS